MYVTTICVTKFEPEFQKYKAQDVTRFINVKGWIVSPSVKLLFGYIS